MRNIVGYIDEGCVANLNVILKELDAFAILKVPSKAGLDGLLDSTKFCHKTVIHVTGRANIRSLPLSPSGPKTVFAPHLSQSKIIGLSIMANLAPNVISDLSRRGNQYNSRTLGFGPNPALFGSFGCKLLIPTGNSAQREAPNSQGASLCRDLQKMLAGNGLV